MANYSNAFSPSFKSNTFITKSIPGVTDVASKSINLSNINFNAVKDLKFNPNAFAPGLNLVGGGGWKFICAPEEISWDTSNAVQRIGIFGTNNPPVVSGSRGMRDLTLGNAIVEGFVRNVTVEDKILALEKLLNYNLNSSDGFVSVPVYQVWANQKAYGNSGYFILKDVRVKESMRDLKGDATRATVDVSFMEVPSYQVNSGRDLASKPAAAAKAALIDPKITRAQQQAAQTKSVTGQVDKNVNPNTRDKAGAPKPETPKQKPTATLPGQALPLNEPPKR